MAYQIVMPKWGLSMQHGLINRWLKNEGDPIEKGEALLEIESDKIANVVEAPAAGILARIVHPSGSEVAVSEVIGIITAAGEPIPEIPAAQAAAPTQAGPAPAATAPDKPPAGQPGRIRAMPKARRMARDHGLDLASIQGTGPNGAITVRDVEQSIASPTVRRPLQKISFFSEGHRLSGLLYAPESGTVRGAVVMCVGYTYLKELVMPEIAKALNAAGFVALAFDYRGFGESDGPRSRLIPREQINDARAAVTYLADLPYVDPQRMAAIGLSLGGSHALAAAAQDRRIGAVVAIESPGDGERWMRSLRRHYEWLELETRLTADRSQRVRNGESLRVDPLDIVPADPDSQDFLNAAYQEYPQMKTDLPLETAEAIIEYRPETTVSHISPRPILLIHGDQDRLVPVAESQSLFDHANEPKELAVLSGLDHFNWVMPQSPGFQRVTGMIVDFLGKHFTTI